MILRSRLALFVLLITLTACTAPRQAVLPANQVQPEPPAAQPGATTAPALPATRTPRSSPAALPESPAEPTQLPAPAGIVYPVPEPLTGPAPWLMFPCAAAETGGVPTIANSDGSGCVPFPLPVGVPDRAWISAASARSSYVAFRVTINPQAIDAQAASAPKNARYGLQPNGLDDQLWIVKLPENRILRKITQIDGGGWQRIQKMGQSPSGEGSAEPNLVPLAVILDPASYRWSPNGRFLAYTGVDKDGVDLFVYDSLNDTIRRMSSGRTGAFFWSWSPDGKWIVYHDMAGCRMEQGRCQLERGPHYFAIAFPKPEYQFEDNFAAGDIDWIAKNRYLLQDIPAQGQLSHRLVQVDLANGSVTNLYEEPFYSYTYVPKTYVSLKEMYLLNLPAEPANDRVTGIYTLYPPRQVDWLRPFHTGIYAGYTMQWERTLEKFVLSKDIAKDLTGSPVVQKEVVLAPIVLLEPVPLGVLGTSRLVLSPDGAWFTTRLASGNWALYTKQGQQVQDLGAALPGQENPVYWQKDSSAFTFFGSRPDCASSFGCVYRFARDQAWKAVMTGALKAKADILQVIEP